MTFKPLSKPKRSRGVILTSQGWHKLQQAKQEAEAEHNWSQHFTLEQLGERTGLSLHTVSRILKREEGVDKQSLEYFLRAFGLELDKGDCARPVPPFEELAARQSNPQQDWAEAADVSVFYGRSEELIQLRQWILEEHCRLLALLGIGGIGKSSLVVKLALQIQPEFEAVVWRSLQNAPPLEELLGSVLQFLMRVQGEDTLLPETLDGRVTKLMDCLRSSRCLLILDNAETILGSGRQAGQWQEGYEGYGQLLKRVGEVPHQSCVLLTSREKPREIALLEGERLPVRSLQLAGLKPADGRELFRNKGQFTGSEAEWNKLIEHYGGNPLALKLVAAATHELFDGRIAGLLEYAEQGVLVVEDIRDLLERQFNRLSEVEQEVMYWFAINREPISVAELSEDVVSATSRRELLGAVNSLLRRSLIEQSAARFNLQPVVMEYVTERLVKSICHEITTQNLELLRTHALIKAQAKDYVREMQGRLIVEPVMECLLMALGSHRGIEGRLKELLVQQREQAPLQPGYVGGNVLNLLVALGTDLRGYDFSNLTVWQASLQGVNLPQVNFAHADLGKSIFKGTLGAVFGIAFSPDGELLATGDAEGGVRVWQVATGKPLSTFGEHTGWVWSVAFSPDGRLLASCGEDQTVRLWDVSSGQCLQTLHGHQSSVWSVAFSPDGRTLASGSDECSVSLWQVSSGRCLRTLQGHTGRVLSVAFSPDGQTLASGSDEPSVKLWEVSSGRCLNTLEGHTDRIWSVTFSPDGSTLASGSADDTIRLWEVTTGQCLGTLEGHTDRVRSVAFHAEGHILASSSDDQAIKLWEVSTGECFSTLRGHTDPVFSVAFNVDGSTLASGSSDQTARLWDFDSGRCLRTLRGYTNSVYSVVFHPEGDRLASGSTDQTVRLWEVGTGQCLKTLEGHNGWVLCVAFHPEGHLLASSSADQTIRLWDVSSGRCLHTLDGHSGWIQSVRFSPDGHLLVSGGDDQTLRLWDVSSGECLSILRGHSNWVWSVAFSPNDQLLASGSEDQTIRLWDVSSGQCLSTLQGHASRVQAVRFSPDGRTLASSSGDQTIRLWDVSSGQCLQVFHGHENTVWSIAFDSEGRQLASISLDQTIRLWEVSSGQCLSVLERLNNPVRSSIAFQPAKLQVSRKGAKVKGEDSSSGTRDGASNRSTEPMLGSLLVSGSHNGALKLWNSQTGQCLKVLNPERPYTGMNITGVTGLTALQKAALKTLGAVES
ncbi:NB-ARC domain-containing protein [Leptolyngbya sp. FACHB-261]|uniref:WD40 domain-containing protein n=1 Tax=Leptolyngbya sp. FACHB-261 TaxID=2692806 RepID=UPI0016865767|nr:NB-ARC domain-containing protein [Leptolyngbya sp. FACHB-261]MBD2100197.1 hypothetical protein [Leptolyngbya sp. FACHB-261]